jgi:hypothetical protein
MEDSQRLSVHFVDKGKNVVILLADTVKMLIFAP